MANPQLSHMPSGDFSIARKVMGDAVAFHLANGGPTVARQHVEQLANELKIYSDINEAYLDAMARIAEAERMEQQKAEERTRTRETQLPPKLSTAKAMLMWQRLQQAELIDDCYLPVGLSRTERAMLADQMARRLKIKDKWKTFERLWGCVTLRSDYNRALDQKKSRAFLKKLSSLLHDIQ